MFAREPRAYIRRQAMCSLGALGPWGSCGPRWRHLYTNGRRVVPSVRGIYTQQNIDSQDEDTSARKMSR